jgi:hypothetical protein
LSILNNRYDLQDHIRKPDAVRTPSKHFHLPTITIDLVFQAEVYATKACAVENLDTKYKNRNIYILPDSQAAIKGLGTHQITSKPVWDCHQSLTQLAGHNRVQLIWVPGHEGIAGNETADQLELPRRRSGAGGTEIIKKHWESTVELKQAKLNKDQLRWVLGIFTRHYHLKAVFLNRRAAARLIQQGIYRVAVLKVTFSNWD